jgi:hypothetical protein
VTARQTLDERRAAGLCSMCGERLSETEKALEGVGGSYVRCDECVREIQRGDWLMAPGAAEA